jgi:integrase
VWGWNGISPWLIAPKMLFQGMGNLSAMQVRNLKEPGRYSDGDGLLLQVRPNGAKSWLARIQTNGKRRDIGLGDAHQVSLAEAREALLGLRKQAREGVDPLSARRKQRAIMPTFKDAVHQAHRELLKGWKNGKHTDQWITTMEIHAFPSLGKLPVDQIDGPMVRDALAKIWLDKPETARRVKQRIGTVLDWCYAKGYRLSEAPMRSIARGLPRQPKQTGHFAAMPHAQVPMFMASLSNDRTTIGKLALELLILTACRSGEVRGAKWSEFSKGFDCWTIPAIRMKAGVAHRIPQSAAAKEVMARVSAIRVKDGDLVFPGQEYGKALSDMTLLKILRDAKLPFTVHGFRSSFRDWVAEMTEYPREIAEAALAHTLQNKVEAAYRRTDYFEKRRAMMDDWATFCMSARS